MPTRRQRTALADLPDSPDAPTATASREPSASRDAPAVEASARRLRAIFDHTFQLTGLLAPDGTLLEANQRALDFVGAGRDEVIGKPFWDTPWFASSAALGERLRDAVRAAAGGDFVRFEYEAQDPDGRPAWFDFSLTPVADESGRVVFLIPEGRDITDRRLAEEALRASEAKFAGMVSIAADAIISVDESHRITLFNDGAALIFGYTPAEVVGRPLGLLIPKRFRDAHEAHVSAFAASPVSARRMAERREVTGVRKSGEEFPAEASISKIEAGGHQLFTVVLRDITERKRAEEEKTRLLALEREARAAAEEASRLRDEVLGVVSHDLRNPLSAISMCASSLLEEPPPDDGAVRHLAEIIQESAAWTQRMIQDLLDVASIEAGRLSLERRREDPLVIAMRAAELFEPLAAARSIRLAVEMPDHLPAVDADAERVLQVLGNLLGNALKFVERGGTVTLRGSGLRGAVQFSVRDTGPGIPAEHIGYIFDRFWHARRAARTRGTGLGLAISKGIVEAHGGAIWVESTPGTGSTFHFTLPLARANGRELARAPARGESSGRAVLPDREEAPMVADSPDTRAPGA